jgi:GNAT superfamily N-acetyltransferase
MLRVGVVSYKTPYGLCKSVVLFYVLDISYVFVLELDATQSMCIRCPIAITTVPDGNAAQGENTMPGSSILYRTGGSELLKAIRPLWEMNFTQDGPSADDLANAFPPEELADLRALLASKPGSSRLRVTLALDQDNGELAGFCLSTGVPRQTGEINCLFVFPEYRECGIAEGLMRDAIQWLDDMGVQTRSRQLGADRDRDYRFYSDFGFLPRNIVHEEHGLMAQ